MKLVTPCEADKELLKLIWRLVRAWTGITENPRFGSHVSVPATLVVWKRSRKNRLPIFPQPLILVRVMHDLRDEVARQIMCSLDPISIKRQEN